MSQLSLPKSKGKLLVRMSRFGDISMGFFPKESPNATRILFHQLHHLLSNQRLSHIERDKFISIVLRPVHQIREQYAQDTKLLHAYHTLVEQQQTEKHSRLKFLIRGMVALDLAQNALHITLAPLPEWNFKYTIVGMVDGDTIFNVLRMAESMLPYMNQPESEQHIPFVDAIDIVWNPFTDLIIEPPPTEQHRSIPTTSAPPKKKPQVLNANLLSFHDDAMDQDNNLSIAPRGIKSMHDALADKKFSTKTVTINKKTRKRKRPTADEDTEEQKKVRIDESLADEHVSEAAPQTKASSSLQEASPPLQQDDDDHLHMQRKLIDKMNAQREQLRLQREKEKEQEELAKFKFKKAIQKSKEKQNSKGRAYLEEQRQKYLNKKKTSMEELDDTPTLSVLLKGKSSLLSTWTKGPLEFDSKQVCAEQIEDSSDGSDAEWEVIEGEN